MGGGIPIIRPLTQCLAANEVSEIAGILNGTTNFILTKMINEKMSFEDALKLAQDLGYAERDPSADVEGDAACRKICILASLAFGYHVYPYSVYTKGITEITLEDVGYAKAWGGAIKLIGAVKKLENGKIHIIVSPMFVNYDSQLSHVDDVFNGILVRGDATGDVVFYGKGAGKLPTASAVVADVIDCIKHFKSRKYLFWEDERDNYVEDHMTYKYDYFIRINSDDIEKAIKHAKDVFGKIYRIVRENEEANEAGFIVKDIGGNDLEEKLDSLKDKAIKIVSKIFASDY